MMKKVYVSFGEMEKAFNRVRRELEGQGLLFAGSRLDKVDCYYEGLSFGGLAGCVGIMGFYNPKKSDKAIHIPAVFPMALFPWWDGREILDVIRHEFGHALADRFRKLFRGAIFKEAFGGGYGEKKVFDGYEWERGCVSAYAATSTREDFAETFMLYMKHKGKLPARYRGKRAVEKKWKAVARIIRIVSSMGC